MYSAYVDHHWLGQIFGKIKKYIIGDCFPRAFFLITEGPYISGRFFHGKKLSVNLEKNRLGNVLGAFYLLILDRCHDLKKFRRKN
jgi:hypothetical protein